MGGKPGGRARVNARILLTVRWSLAVIAVLTAVVVAFLAWRERPTATSFPARPLNDGMRAAIELQLDSAQSLFQICLVFVAALWGLVIAKSDEARITLSDRPEVILFVAASALLLASSLMYQWYVAEITEAFRIAGSFSVHLASGSGDVPDVFSEHFAHLFWFQRRFLIAGAVCGVVTLVSAHQLKPR